MANDIVDKEEKAADGLTEVDPTADSHLSSPISHYDDPEDEIRRQEEPDEKRAEREELKRSQSYATDASALTRTTTRLSTAAPLPQKPWYKTPNPLRWGSIPPVPKEREVSREHAAGFFSRLTFQWMAPLMNVGKPLPVYE